MSIESKDPHPFITKRRNVKKIPIEIEMEDEDFLREIDVLEREALNSKKKREDRERDCTRYDSNGRPENGRWIWTGEEWVLTRR